MGTESKNGFCGLHGSSTTVTHCMSIPGSERSPGGECGNPLEYSCLENPMDGVDYTVHGVTKSRTRLSDLTN